MNIVDNKLFKNFIYVFVYICIEYTDYNIVYIYVYGLNQVKYILYIHWIDTSTRLE